MAGFTKPPIDVDALARHEGLHVVYERFATDVSGTLVRERDGRVVLGVNTFHARSRQRFTVAHEIGHWRLHLQGKTSGIFVDRPAEVLFRDRLSSQGVDKKEVEANSFAAALLMPASFVEAEARRQFKRDPRTSDDELVGALANRFDVSDQAMRYRLINLHIVDPL